MDSTQVFGNIAIAAFHIMSAYFVGRSYYYFRKNGGIWGTGEDAKIAKAAAKASQLFNKAALVAENQIDKADA